MIDTPMAPDSDAPQSQGSDMSSEREIDAESLHREGLGNQLLMVLGLSCDLWSDDKEDGGDPCRREPSHPCSEIGIRIWNFRKTLVDDASLYVIRAEGGIKHDAQ